MNGLSLVELTIYRKSVAQRICRASEYTFQEAMRWLEFTDFGKDADEWEVNHRPIDIEEEIYLMDTTEDWANLSFILKQVSCAEQVRTSAI